MFVGVDVGGTKIATARLQGRSLSESVLHETVQSSQDALVEQLVRAIGEATASGDEPAAAVGIGVPSIVDFATGRIRSSVNVPLDDLPLRELLSERVGLPVYVDNDASCAALAEAFEDGRLTCPELVLFTLGTGVGAGLVLGGRLYRGATGAAGEIGHTLMGADLERGDALPAHPDFPQPGSVEFLAAGRALDRLAASAAQAEPDGFLGRRRAEQGSVDGRDVVAGCEAGDGPSGVCMRVLGERLGVAIANAVNTFDPLEVVVGGGVSRAGEWLLGPARESAARHIVPGVGTRTQIRVARHGARAGVLGAALMAAQEEHERANPHAAAADAAL